MLVAICHQLITFANGLDQEEDRSRFGLKPFDTMNLQYYFGKVNFE